MMARLKMTFPSVWSCMILSSLSWYPYVFFFITFFCIYVQISRIFLKLEFLQMLFNHCHVALNFCRRHFLCLWIAVFLHSLSLSVGEFSLYSMLSILRHDLSDICMEGYYSTTASQVCLYQSVCLYQYYHISGLYQYYLNRYLYWLLYWVFCPWYRQTY